MLRTILLLTACLVLANCEPISSDRPLSFTVIEATVTAYSPSPAQTQGDPFQMASGKKATQQDLHELRYAAVSRDLLSKFSKQGLLRFGDKVYIEFTVEDTMDSRFTNRVDIFFRNAKLARLFGTTKRRVILLIQQREARLE